MLIDEHVWNEDLQCFTSENHRRVAEVINDYDSRLFLAFVPPQLRALDEEHPFAVIYQPEGRPQQVIMKLKENEINESLIARIWSADNRHGNVLDRLDAQDDARKALAMKEQLERDEANRDYAQTILNSPLHTFRHNGKKYT